MKNLLFFIIGFLFVFCSFLTPYLYASEWVVSIIRNPKIEIKTALEIEDFKTEKVRYVAVINNEEHVHQGKLNMDVYIREKIYPPVKVDSERYKELLCPSHIIMGKQ